MGFGLKQMRKINDFSLKQCKEHFIFLDMKRYGLTELFIKNKMSLAGGAIIRMLDKELMSDLDMYFKDECYIEMFLNDIEDYNEKQGTYKFKLECKTSNSYSYNFGGYKFQFIILPHMIHNDMNELLSLFDFGVCQIAFDFEFNDFVYTKQFMKDINTKSITFNINSPSPICSLLRLDKYKKRGFEINNFELLKLSLSIQKLKFNTYKDVSFAFTGVSTGYYTEFVKLLTSEDYKDQPYDLPEMLKLLDEFMVAQEVMRKLCGGKKNKMLLW